MAYVHHSNGTCMTFADGHSEYWRWKDPLILAWGHWWEDLLQVKPDAKPPHPPNPTVENPDYIRLFKAIWGKGP